MENVQRRTVVGIIGTLHATLESVLNISYLLTDYLLIFLHLHRYSLIRLKKAASDRSRHIRSWCPKEYL